MTFGLALLEMLKEAKQKSKKTYLRRRKRMDGKNF